MIGEIIQRDKTNKFTTIKIIYIVIFGELVVMVNTIRVVFLILEYVIINLMF